MIKKLEIKHLGWTTLMGKREAKKYQEQINLAAEEFIFRTNRKQKKDNG